MNDEFSDEDNDIDGDDKASLWLEDMGLDKRDFPSLEPLKVKLYPLPCHSLWLSCSSVICGIT